VPLIGVRKSNRWSPNAADGKLAGGFVDREINGYRRRLRETLVRFITETVEGAVAALPACQPAPTDVPAVFEGGQLEPFLDDSWHDGLSPNLTATPAEDVAGHVNRARGLRAGSQGAESPVPYDLRRDPHNPL
jgi:hypothetical protein